MLLLLVFYQYVVRLGEGRRERVDHEREIGESSAARFATAGA